MKRFLCLVLAFGLLVLSSCAKNDGKNKDVDLHISDPIAINLSYTVAFRSEDTALAKEFDSYLGEMLADGSLLQMCEDYTGRDHLGDLWETGWFHGDGADDSAQRVRDAGKLIIGYQNSCFPMSWTDANGTEVGFDIRIAEEICRRMGLQVQFVDIKWEHKDSALDTGTVDCMLGSYGYTDERAAKYNLTRPYFTTDLVLISLGENSVESLDDLQGEVVGARTESIAQTLLENSSVKFSRIVPLVSNSHGYYRLSEKSIRAILVERVFADYAATGKLEK